MDRDLMNLLTAWMQKALETQLAGTATEYTAGGMAYSLYTEIEELGVLGEEA